MLFLTYLNGGHVGVQKEEHGERRFASVIPFQSLSSFGTKKHPNKQNSTIFSL